MENNKKKLFKFDKFIDSIIKDEDAKKRHNIDSEEVPQRDYIKKYRELWQNRIKWSNTGDNKTNE